MLVAGDRLRSSSESILAIAVSLGYESESAFGKAFKRVMGCSPRQYGRSENLNQPYINQEFKQHHGLRKYQETRF